MGLEARAAIAGIAAAAARASPRFAPGTIVAAGRMEAAIMEPLDVEALGLDPEATAVLRRAGLEDGGAGGAPHPRRTHRALRGSDGGVARSCAGPHRTPNLAAPSPSPDFMAEQRFAELHHQSRRRAGNAEGRAGRVSVAGLLSRHGEGARALEAVFFRADGAVRRIAVETGASRCGDAKPIVTRLFRERMDALVDPLDPGFGFDIIRLCARASHAIAFDRSRPCAAIDSSANAEQDVADLTDRLAAQVSVPTASSLRFRRRTRTSRKVSGKRGACPAQTRKPAIVDWARRREAGEAPRRPLRLFEKPQPIEVVAEVPEGLAVALPLARRAARATRQAEGPERIAMEWWRTETARPTRDYFRLEDEEGRRFWIYRDGLYGRETQSSRWYLHGLFA